VRDNAQRLTGLPSAFVSVSLAVLQTQPEVRREVAATVQRFLTATGWRPSCTKSIAGALLYTKYDWLKRWIMRRITAKAGGDVDTSRDYEYTDWQDLRSFAEQFGRTVMPAAGVDRREPPRAQAAEAAAVGAGGLS
jgi:menaquinone-dependent protoporphyrinogen oxidase